MIKCHFEKVLLPVDRSEHAERAVTFAGKILSNIEDFISEITILYVIAGGYLSEHMKNIDFRAEILVESELFKKIKMKHYEENIKPFLESYEQILRDEGVKTDLKKTVLEGDPGNKIIEHASKENFSTVILSRRGMSSLKGFFVGSVSNKVIHGLIKQNIYLVGHKIAQPCPVSRVLVPVDGSEYSMKAVEHATCLAKLVKGIQKITVLRVINVSLYLERIRHGIDPEQEAEDILKRAKKRFLEGEVSEEFIITKTRVGFPAEEIVKEAEEGQFNLIIMGRKGRSALKDLVLGGVSSSVINKCFDQTVAIINL